MGSRTSNSLGSTSIDDATRRVNFYTICGMVIFVLTSVVLALGKAIPFISENVFLTFLGWWFMLIAAIAYWQSYKISAKVVRKTGKRELQRTNRGMSFMSVLSALISFACLISLIFT